MSATRSKPRSAKLEPPLRGRADLAGLRRQSDRAIADSAPPELADLPADFWDDAELVWPAPKQAISLRLDRDVLQWFRAQGPRYQSRINAVLRTYMSRVGSRPKRPRRTRAA